MTLSKDGPTTPPAGLVPAHVDRIEEELSRRWCEDAKKHSVPHMHSCAMTIIAWVEEETDSRGVLDVVEQLGGKHPVRAIVLRASDAMPEEKVSAWIGTGCTGVEASEAVCSEEIVLHANVHSPERLSSVVHGLLVPDLPVYLWWRSGSPFSNAVFRLLRPLADRIVVDSILFGDGAAALDTLRRLVQQGGARTTVRDLNWQRTEPWRNAIAACFDDADVLAMLPDLNRCAVTYASPAESKASARSLLMSGWLASRYEPLRGHCKLATSQTVDISLGRVASIALSSSTDKVSLLLERQQSPAGIKAAANMADGRLLKEWIFPAKSLSEAELLDRCLDALGRDALFELALEAW